MNNIAEEHIQKGYEYINHSHVAFVDFIPETGPRRAFQTAYILGIEYAERTPSKLRVFWSTDIATVEGAADTLEQIYENLSTNRCRRVIHNGKTITKITVAPIKAPASDDPFG